MARSWLVVIILSVCAFGCLDRTRVNAQCEWDPETAGSLELSRWPHQRHLYEDVELAEELAIRYADAVHKERFGFNGHGGLIENGQLRDRCMAALMTAIGTTHHLSVEQVEQARARGYRDPHWDLGVLLSFAGLYGLGAWLIVGAISRRFPAGDGWPAVIAQLLASLPVAFAAFQLFTLWGAGLEALRLGNGHLSSYRASKIPWAGHGAALWMADVSFFLLIAGIRHWRQERRHRRPGYAIQQAPGAERRLSIVGPSS